MPIIGVVLTYLADRLGVRLALALTIIAVISGIFLAFTLIIEALLSGLEIPQNEYLTTASQALPANTQAMLSLILSARTAKWVFKTKLAAIRWYISPQKSMF